MEIDTCTLVGATVDFRLGEETSVMIYNDNSLFTLLRCPIAQTNHESTLSRCNRAVERFLTPILKPGIEP